MDLQLVLDVVLARDPWAGESAELLTRIDRGEHEAVVAAPTVLTVQDVVRRARDDRTASLAVTQLLALVAVVPVGEAELRRALALGLPDFADGVQAACAVTAGVDAIVTRTPGAFDGGGVPALRAGAVV